MVQKLIIEKISCVHINQTMSTLETHPNLVTDLKAGKRSAQEYFYKLYFPKMFPIAFRFSGSKEEAHEIINTAFLRVIRSINNFAQDNFGGWVYTIVRRTAIDYFRKYNYQNVETLELAEYDEVRYNEALTRLHLEDVLGLVQKLPAATRTVFNLFVFDEMTHEEIAQKLSISKGTSKWHVANARSILTELFNSLNQGL